MPSTTDAADAADAGSTSTWTPLPIPSTTAPGTTDDGTTSDGTTDCNFICDDDTPDPIDECDEFAQDCVAGEKCTWADIDGDGAFDSTICVPLVREPAGIEEPCLRLSAKGQDTCDVGQLCWDPDPNGVGMCMALCAGSPENPTCPDGTRCVGKTINLCMAGCEPLLQDCPVGCGCYPGEPAVEFFCFTDVSGEGGSRGDTCEQSNECNPGLFCGERELVPGCEGTNFGCCTDFCEFDDPGTCDEACVPWFEEGEAPPQLEGLGACLKEPTP